MRIYVATEGRWSDYSIIGVFSTREKAEEFSENDVEEYELDGIKRLTYFQVLMDKAGNTLFISGKDYIAEEPKKSWYYIPSDLLLYANVNANDEETAVKIVNEKRAMILANNLWKAGWRLDE